MNARSPNLLQQIGDLINELSYLLLENQVCGRAGSVTDQHRRVAIAIKSPITELSSGSYMEPPNP